MSSRTPRPRATRAVSAKSAKKPVEESPKLSAAFTQRKLTDFRANPSKSKDKLSPAAAKRTQDALDGDVDAVVDVCSPEEPSKRAKVAHEIVVDEGAEAEAATGERLLGVLYPNI
ncbi:hypothetical protein HDU86_004581 [Geranomyces michiganensis]|nr:hypothetical protein HDU86_004581 [Geranomyces michiganensis]